MPSTSTGNGRKLLLRGAVAALALTGSALLPTSPALAGVGSYCGHGSGSHWHWLTYNSYTFLSSKNFYAGSGLVHQHKYVDAYVTAMPQQWNEYEYKYCGLHY